MRAMMPRLKLAGVMAALCVCACDANDLDGSYHGGDGEGTRVAMVLSDGRAQFWQRGLDQAPLLGHYSQERGRVILQLAGRTLVLGFDGRCLFPAEDPTQRLCKAH